jgi:hypothetical protein
MNQTVDDEHGDGDYRELIRHLSKAPKLARSVVRGSPTCSAREQRPMRSNAASDRLVGG